MAYPDTPASTTGGGKPANGCNVPATVPATIKTPPVQNAFEHNNGWANAVNKK